MPRSIFNARDVMDLLPVITDQEENRYSDIPNWKKCRVEFTSRNEKSVLLIMDDEREIWMPISQLRKAEDGNSVYASNWILNEKGIG